MDESFLVTGVATSCCSQSPPACQFSNHYFFLSFRDPESLMNRLINNCRQKLKSTKRLLLCREISILILTLTECTRHGTISSLLIPFISFRYLILISRKLKYIVDEMVDTERDYVKSLEYIIQVLFLLTYMCDVTFPPKSWGNCYVTVQDYRRFADPYNLGLGRRLIRSGPVALC